MDDKTVKCFLSNEELEQYDIDYKDFITRSDKAREIVQEIIAQAQEELGYKPPRFAFDLQIMMVPDQGLVLTFSDKDPDVKDEEKLMECLKEMKRILQQTKEQTNEVLSEQVSNKKGEQKKPGASAQELQKKPEIAVFTFQSLRDVMNYAMQLPGNLRVDSELFEMGGAYLLYIQKGHASYDRFSKACIQALEFGNLYTADEGHVLQLREHGSCLISEKAIRKLRG